MRWHNTTLSVMHGLGNPPRIQRSNGEPSGASLEVPVCLFPHHRLAKQKGPLALPRVSSLSTPGRFDLTDGRGGAERAFQGSELGVCGWVVVCVFVCLYVCVCFRGGGGRRLVRVKQVKGLRPFLLSACLLVTVIMRPFYCSHSHRHTLREQTYTHTHSENRHTDTHSENRHHTQHTVNTDVHSTDQSI